MPQKTPEEIAALEVISAEHAVRRAKLRREEKRVRRDEKIATAVQRWKLKAARTVGLAEHAFKADDHPDVAKLKPHEKALVRGWEQPKRLAPFALEASARLIDSEVRAKGEAKRISINAENMIIQLPEKKAEEMEPVVITVEANQK